MLEWLAARHDDVLGTRSADLLEECGEAESVTLLRIPRVLCVAPGAADGAALEPNEDRRQPERGAFGLDRTEDLRNANGRLNRGRRYRRRLLSEHLHRRVAASAPRGVVGAVGWIAATAGARLRATSTPDTVRSAPSCASC